MALPFVHPPCNLIPQGQNSSTFRVPPLDGSCTVPELFQYNAQHSPDHPYFVYANQQNETVAVTYRQTWDAIKRAAAVIRDHVQPLTARYDAQNRASDCPPTIGILASADTITFSVFMHAIMRLGYAAFPLSARNSAAGVAHLIRQTHVLQLFVSPDPAMQRLSAGAVELLKKDGYLVQVLPITQFDNSETSTPPELDFPKLELDKVVCIYHSSGSSAFPKPISFRNRILLHLAMVPCKYYPLFSNHIESQIVFKTTAMSICVGWSSACTSLQSSPATSGLPIGVFEPCSPPMAPTAANYLKGIIATNTKILLCVPSFVETWFTDPTAITALKSLRAIAFAGAPLSKAVGDQLIKMGVALFPSYGSTETGALNQFIPGSVPGLDEWEYFKISAHLKIETFAYDESERLYEFAIINTPWFRPNVINYSAGDKYDGYRTGDLLQRHPTDSTLWKVFGRADDQLVLSTGEKTNPIPLEAILLQDAHITGAVIFGSGRPENGVLIEPKPDYVFDPADPEGLTDFRMKIWPTVLKMNEFAPAHSRVLKEMIIVSSPAKPFEYTAKGTARRQSVLNAYAAEIGTLYDTADTWQSDVPAPSTWSSSDTLEFVRSLVTKAINASVGDDVDVFQYGCDSLQATYIRRAISSALQQSLGIPSSRVPQSLVYDHPTISSLVHFVRQLVLPSESMADVVVPAEKIKRMQTILDKYSAAFPARTASNGTTDCAQVAGQTVLVTGTTGRLGCHVLAQLLSAPLVVRVYALNRGREGDLLARQRAAFEACGLDPALLESEKVELHAANLAAVNLGLAEGLYRELVHSVTNIVHIAWHVNFKMSLASFEPLLVGVRNLVNLALASPHSPSILFTSSIGVFQNKPSSPSPIHELAVEPEWALGTGYGESKWVAEELLLRAAKETGLRTHVVRVGQLCGDTVTGAWNEKEWLPALVRGSQILRAVPQMDEAISWIPLDVAASVLLEISADAKADGVFHLVHPRPIKWSAFCDTAAKRLEVSQIPYQDWVSALQKAAAEESDSANPALRLVDFFAAYETAPVPDTQQTAAGSSSLRDAVQLTGEDVARWIGSWQRVGFVE